MTNQIELTTRPHIAKAGWNAMKIILDENNAMPTKEVPNPEFLSPAEVGVIMEAMGNLAKAIDVGNETEVELDLGYPQACALWHSCNVVLQNDLTKVKDLKMRMMELMSILAPRLDGEISDEPDIEVQG